MQHRSQLLATDIIKHPLCACGATMWLVSIEPADCPGVDIRNFECPRCFNPHRVWTVFSSQHRIDQGAANAHDLPPLCPRDDRPRLVLDLSVTRRAANLLRLRLRTDCSPERD
jgi:hypothetical protein